MDRRERRRAWFRSFNGEARQPIQGRVQQGKYILFGEVLGIDDLAELSGLSSGTVLRRLRRGMSVEAAVFTACGDVRRRAAT